MSRFANSVIVFGNFLIPLVNCYHHWKSLTQKFSTSELLTTSESVEYQTILSNMEEKMPTVSPDQSATGETTTSFENKEAGMQTGLSEEEKEPYYKEEYDNTIFKVLENIIMQASKAGWSAWIGLLLRHFEMENRSKSLQSQTF